MTPVKFPGSNVVFAENQPEYLPLSAHKGDDGVVTFCWRLTLRERFALLFRGLLWHQVMTFGHALQPQSLSATRPSPDTKEGA